MKFPLAWIAVALLSAASASATLVHSIDDVSYWVGSGPNRAVLVIDWEDGKTTPGETTGQSLAWGFRWPNTANPTGIDMIKAVALADPRLVLHIVARPIGSGSYETVFGLFYDLDGDGGTATFDPLGESGNASDPADHFAEGWFINGSWAYFTGSGATQPTWTYSLGGAHQRPLANNSWDGWSFRTYEDPGTDSTPDIAAAAVPEPSGLLLLVLGAGILHRRR